MRRASILLTATFSIGALALTVTGCDHTRSSGSNGGATSAYPNQAPAAGGNTSSRAPGAGDQGPSSTK